MAARGSEGIWASGTLIQGASSVTGPTYGGTILGTMQEVTLIVDDILVPLPHPEYGDRAGDYLIMGQEIILSTLISDWDPDAVAAAFPNVAAGSVSHPKSGNIPVVTWGPTLTTGVGDLLSARASTLLLVPKDSARHPGLFIYEALPSMRQSRLNWHATADGNLTALITWLAIPNSSEVLAKIAALADMGF